MKISDIKTNEGDADITIVQEFTPQVADKIVSKSTREALKMPQGKLSYVTFIGMA